MQDAFGVSKGFRDIVRLGKPSVSARVAGPDGVWMPAGEFNAKADAVRRIQAAGMEPSIKLLSPTEVAARTPRKRGIFHRKPVSKGVRDILRLGKPVMGMKPAAQGVTHTSVSAPGLSQAMGRMSAQSSASRGQKAMSDAFNRMGATAKPAASGSTGSQVGMRGLDDAMRGIAQGKTTATARRARRDKMTRRLIIGAGSVGAVGGAAGLGTAAYNRKKDTRPQLAG